MKTTVGIGPPRLAVQRGFEGNRLAKDFQALAYEQVLPVRQRVSTGAAAAPVEVAAPVNQQVSEEGIAA